MPLILTYHQIYDDNGEPEVIGYYDWFDSSFTDEENSKIKALLKKEQG